MISNRTQFYKKCNSLPCHVKRWEGPCHLRIETDPVSKMFCSVWNTRQWVNSRNPVSLPCHVKKMGRTLSPENWNRSSFKNVLFCLEYQTMGEFQKPSQFTLSCKKDGEDLVTWELKQIQFPKCSVLFGIPDNGWIPETQSVYLVT